MIRTLLFDLDETLFDFKKAERFAISETLLHYGVTPTEAIIRRYSEINLSGWKRLEKGEIDRTALREERFRLLFGELSKEIIPKEAADFYEVALGKGKFYMPGAPEVLKELYGKYRLYLVTNGFHNTQVARLAGTYIESHFDGIFISEDIGFDKPDPRYFACCFAKIPHFVHEETLLIGDRIASDIVGAKNAGIRSVLFAPVPVSVPDGIRPDFTISALSELPPLLKTL